MCATSSHNNTITPHPLITSISVLDTDECRYWAARVVSLRRYWTPRDPQLPFFTLGMAAYLDAVREDPHLGNRAPYRMDALRQWSNRLLESEFGPLLHRCCEAIASWSGHAARCPGGAAALPGFHIHLFHPVFATSVASRHVDLQYRQVFGQPTVAPEHLLTFTLAVSLPVGSGLRVWHGDTPAFHPYHLGQMTLHNGLSPHQAVLHPLVDPTPRIMLQGHALREDDGWLLYW